MPQNTVRVAFVGRLKNASLSEFLARKKWSQTQLARELGIALTTLNRWVLLKEAPKNEAILHKLEELLGELREDIFPEFFQSNEWKEAQKHASGEHSVIREIPVQVLLRSGRLALPSPEVEYDEKELRELMKEVLNTLSPKEKRVLKLRMGLGDEEEHTRREVAVLFGISQTRIEQIEAQALRKLRHQGRSEQLRPFLEK